MKVGIIYNSFSNKEILPEEIEMRDTGLAIGKLLAKLGYFVRYFDMDNPASVADLCRGGLDAAFDTCERIHGDPRGEAYTAGLLEFLGIPHTRTSSWLISLGINKERVKSILSYHQIATPRFQIFHDSRENLDPGLNFPLFVKGLACENSIGIDDHSLVETDEALREKIGQINTRLGQPALVEEFIGGREFSVAILPGKKNRVLPISEIIYQDLPPNQRFLDYASKWDTASEKYQKTIPVCPARLSEPEKDEISRIALRCYEILELDSYVRIDMRCRGQTPYILEVNQNPSIGEKDSGYVRTCMGYGLDYAGLIQTLLENAMARKSENRIDRTIREKTGYSKPDQKDKRITEPARL